MSGAPVPLRPPPQHTGLKVGVLLGGGPEEAAARNKVTNSLMAITVIIVGVVNCFLLGLMMCVCVGGSWSAIREAGGGGGR